MNRFLQFLCLTFYYYSILVSSKDDTSGYISEGHSEETKSIPGVITLNTANFDSSISDGSKWLIEFYSPWCGHCKRFAPIYESVAKALHSDPYAQIKVAKIDGSENLVLASRFVVRGYPSFYLIDGWDVYQFKNARSKESLIEFATQASKEYEPIPLMSSPLGPFGRFRAFLMRTGMTILDVYNYLTKTKSFPPAVACLLMSSIGVMVGVFMILFIGLFLVSKPKTD